VPTFRKGPILFLAAVLVGGCSTEDKPETAVPVSAATSTAPPPTTTTTPALVPYTGEGFTIFLPSQGEVTKTPPVAGKPGNVTITSQEGANAYVVTYFDLPPGANYDTEVVARDAATRVQGTLTDDRPITFNGYAGRDYRIGGAQNGLTLFGRLLLVKRRVFLLQASLYQAPTTPPDLFVKVLASLTIR